MLSIDEGPELHVIDFLDPVDHDRARYEVWPKTLSEGRWSGQLSFLNAKLGTTIPLLVECLRIDTPAAKPVAVGTISVDIRQWDQPETTSNGGPSLMTTRQVFLAVTRVESLSKREREVLHALIDGQSHKIIAYELEISVRTVEAHRSRMMRRLGVRTLAAAIQIAMVAGAVR